MRAMNRETRRQLERENSKRPGVLIPVPRDNWPSSGDTTRTGVWLSEKYLAQVFDEADGVQRISANRTTARSDGRWDDALTWDEMQEIKRQIGMGDKYAVEIYPRDCDIVNVANMRHLWVMSEPLSIGWFKVSNV